MTPQWLRNGCPKNFKLLKYETYTLMMTRIFSKAHSLASLVSSAKASQTGTPYTFSAALVHHIKGIAKGGRRDEVVCGGPREPVF